MYLQCMYMYHTYTTYIQHSYTHITSNLLQFTVVTRVLHFHVSTDHRIKPGTCAHRPSYPVVCAPHSIHVYIKLWFLYLTTTGNTELCITQQWGFFRSFSPLSISLPGTVPGTLCNSIFHLPVGALFLFPLSSSQKIIVHWHTVWIVQDTKRDQQNVQHIPHTTCKVTEKYNT